MLDRVVRTCEQADVKIITSTLLNLAQIAIDAVIPTTLTAVARLSGKKQGDAGSSLHIFMSNQGEQSRSHLW